MSDIKQYSPSNGRCLLENNSIYNMANILYQDSFISKIYQGKAFLVSDLDLAVADAGYVYFLVPALLLKSVLLSYQVAAEGKSYFKVYINPIITNNGTELPYVKLNGENNIPPDLKVYKNPTFEVIGKGTLIFSNLVLGGLGPQSTGANNFFTLTALLKNDAKYLIEIQNVSGQAKDINTIFEWLELEKGGGEADA